ncbi:hypothetical protein EJ02DRAFT_56548 [Clathrospora elynae]|uniref:Uncharacterized protein n=1 Tax=Clathrospora elynae TaxID=706981 RepID=A0A6A5SJ53_9PLEO|nr:hypothetical protein EJ02DRAFT_56548 [Clathrospora elynae]
MSFYLTTCTLTPATFTQPQTRSKTMGRTRLRTTVVNDLQELAVQADDPVVTREFIKQKLIPASFKQYCYTIRLWSEYVALCQTAVATCGRPGHVHTSWQEVAADIIVTV